LAASSSFPGLAGRKLCESALRKELLVQDFAMVDGNIPIPTKPGLGIELNRAALEKFKEAARRVAAQRGL